ncbi:hypothetical protein [Actinacidiphila paucisporea]|uniref:Secreted protein n=1 Tax=Actinacidiphila paucisporea TaxID=310782 RepID=A0A1M7M3Y9_9ACTN|nr:hypothetical protein [Actinacidiphila paucisporea]SHM84962.1 hypothetical protein SAMN05216499_11571 [Actinacidiphila paucisporea]
MNRRSAITASAVASAVAVLTMGAAPGAIAADSHASGTVHPMSCPMDKGTYVSGAKNTFVPDPGKKVYGATGVTLSITAAKGTSWTGTVTASGTVEVGLIVASAKETYGGSYSWGKTTTVTLGGTWKVPSNKTSGWLALGSMGSHMNWITTQTQPNCSSKTLGKGTINLPKLSPYIAHS